MESWLKNNILTLVFGAGTLVEAISALELILNPVAEIGSPSLFARLTLGVFNWLIPLAPFLLLAMLYFPLGKLVTLWGARHSKYLKRLTEELASLRIGNALGEVTHPERLGLLEHPRVILAVSMVMAALLAYFPYRPDVNPRQIPVGIDASHYIRQINGNMLQEPFSTAATYAFGVAWGGSRPFFLLSVYAAAKLANLGVDVVVKFLPAFFAPLLVLSTYGFLLLSARSKELASISALLTASSPVVTVGIWAGYYANWLALVETFAFLGFLLSQLRSPSNSKLAACIALSVALLFTHLWTWIVVIPVILLFLWSLRGDIPSRSLLKAGGSILLFDAIAELLKSTLVATSGVVAQAELVASVVTSPLSNATAFFPNVAYALTQTYDGLLANSTLLFLVLVSVITLRRGDWFERLMLCWAVLTSLAFPFFDSLLQSRLVYNLPITVIGSLGLLWMTLHAPVRNIDKHLILLLVILFNANYALLAMTSLPLL